MKITLKQQYGKPYLELKADTSYTSRKIEDDVLMDFVEMAINNGIVIENSSNFESDRSYARIKIVDLETD